MTWKPGDGGFIGRRHSAETRAAIARASRGRTISEEQRSKISASLSGRSNPGTSAALKRYRRTMPKEHRERLAAAVSAAHAGVPSWNAGLTQETDSRVRRNAEAVRVHAEHCDGPCHNGQNPSALAWKAYDLLLKDFEVVIPEARFGPYSVDFLLAEEWLGVEIDGEYWHSRRKGEDNTRDVLLLEKYGLPIVRLSEQDLDFRRRD